MKKLITMLSALTITTSISPLTVACGKENPKEEIVDLSKITAEEIIKFKDKYTGDTDSGFQQILVTPDQLGSLKDEEIINIIKDNLTEMLAKKLFGIEMSKLDFKNLTEEQEIKQNIWFLLFHAEIIDPQGKGDILETIKFDVVKEENSDKKFVATITVEKWDSVKKQIADSIKHRDEEFAKMSKKSPAELEKGYPMFNKKNEEQIKEQIKKIKKIYESVNINSVKSAYDRVKGEKAVINIDLSNKKLNI